MIQPVKISNSFEVQDYLLTTSPLISSVQKSLFQWIPHVSKFGFISEFQFVFLNITTVSGKNLSTMNNSWNRFPNKKAALSRTRKVE
jgi:hypothetical protein